MAALTAERSVSRAGAEMTGTPPVVPLKVKTGIKIWKGSLVATDATGFAIAGAGIAATGLILWGVAEQTVDNTAGASGALTVHVRQGVFPFTNLGGDAVAQADIGKGVFCDDDQTIRKTSNTSTRSNVGVFMGFADDGTSALVRVGILSQTGV
jgi:hypothetical protein